MMNLDEDEDLLPELEFPLEDAIRNYIEFTPKDADPEVRRETLRRFLRRNTRTTA